MQNFRLQLGVSFTLPLPEQKQKREQAPFLSCFFSGASAGAYDLGGKKLQLKEKVDGYFKEHDFTVPQFAPHTGIAFSTVTRPPPKTMSYQPGCYYPAVSQTLSVADEPKISRVYKPPLDTLTQGPLELSPQTVRIKELLEKIAGTSLEQMTTQYRELEGYVLTIEDEEILLSPLLKHADLSQLVLEDELIWNLYQRLENILDRELLAQYFELRMLLPAARFPVNTSDENLNKVNNVLNVVFEIYFSSNFDNINRLFRGESLLDDFQGSLIGANILVAFILGCLINVAINRLPIDSKLFSAEHMRGENLSSSVITARRMSTSSKLPCITSLSRGNQCLKGQDATAWHQVPGYPMVKLFEMEVILAQGRQVIYDGKGATLVNSPELVEDHYSSDLALIAANNYLSKRYSDYDDARVFKGVSVQRPFHGLPHTKRVMEAISWVKDYFIRHAKDDDFKQFCRDLTPQLIEWLRIAAAFSITGRESEISAGTNLERYNEFREASAGHFEEFSKRISVKGVEDEEHLKQHLRHIVRWMGNPQYESKLNIDGDAQKIKQRNYLHRILTIAHKLDLPRCYGHKQFEQSMKLLRDLSTPSEAQQQDYFHLIRLSISHIKAHGDQTCFQVSPDGSYSLGSTTYNPGLFAMCNTSMKGLSDYSATVPRFF